MCVCLCKLHETLLFFSELLLSVLHVANRHRVKGQDTVIDEQDSSILSHISASADHFQNKGVADSKRLRSLRWDSDHISKAL